jgi:stage V sporulation protein B
VNWISVIKILKGEIMKRQSLVKGTLILGIAGILAKAMGILFRWPLIMLIGDEGVGYYQMSYPLYTFFIAIASGVPYAISKMVAEKNAVGDKEGSVQVLRSALLLMMILGGGFSAFLLAFSKDLIHIFNWSDKAYYSLLGISLAPFIISIINSFRGFFQGMQNMYPTAVSQILEQLGRVCLGVGLAIFFLPRGIQYSAGGAAFGATAGGGLAVIYLIYKYFRVRGEFTKTRARRDSNILGRLLGIAIPMSIGATVSSIMGLLDSMIVPRKLLEAGFDKVQATTLFGQYTGKAMVMVSVPLTLSVALCSALVPVIAAAHRLNNRDEVSQKIDTALRISMVVAIPCAFGLYFMASPILGLIFPGHSEGYKILQYLSLCLPFIILSQLSTSILQGAEIKYPPIVNLGMGCIVKVIITYTLVSIPNINIFGAIIGSAAGYMVAALLNIRKLKIAFRIKINYYDILIKPAFAAIIMIIAVVIVYINVYNYTVSNGISTLVAIALGAVIYGLLMLVFGVFRYKYIKTRFLNR